MTKHETHDLNGLPVLPAGHLWSISEPFNATDPIRIQIQKGRAGRNTATYDSQPLATIEAAERWHWLVRLRARQLYRRTFKDGVFIERTVKTKRDFFERYQPIAVFRSEHTTTEPEHPGY